MTLSMEQKYNPKNEVKQSDSINSASCKNNVETLLERKNNQSHSQSVKEKQTLRSLTK